MNKKIVIVIALSLVVLTTGITLFAQTNISKEKKEFYNNKLIEQNNESAALGKETSEVAKMPDGAERQQKEQELKEKNIKFKNEITKIAEEMKKDGYINDKVIIDNNSKLTAKLERLSKMAEMDISNYQDQELIDFDTKKLNKIKTLLEKVKQSDELKFGELYEEYNQMVNLFQEETPIFNEQYRVKHNIKKEAL